MATDRVYKDNSISKPVLIGLLGVGTLLACVALSVPLVNRFNKSREENRLEQFIKPLVGLPVEEALTKIARSDDLKGYRAVRFDDEIHVKSPNHYWFVPIPTIPNAKLTVRDERVATAELGSGPWEQ